MGFLPREAPRARRWLARCAVVQAFVVTNQPESDEHVERHLVSVECRGCGVPVSYAGTGRPPRYCSASCRHRAWALRNAEQSLSAGADPRPEVVREVVERRVEPSAPLPDRAREWERLLQALSAQLDDSEHRLHREHWHHRRVQKAVK